MKRTLALILALVMVLPVSFISALAHGPGVDKNGTTNQSIYNQTADLPEAVYVDGKYDDTGWDKDEWNTVDKRTGTWNVVTPVNMGFSYKYQLKKDGEYLYGVFTLGKGATEITIWLNKDESVYEEATATIVIDDLSSPTPTIKINGDDPDKVNGKYKVQTWQIQAADDTVVSGNRVIEFRLYRKNFADGNNLSYFVAAENSDGDKLYYPNIKVEEGESADVAPDTKWPINAMTISAKDIFDVNSDKHLPLYDSKVEEFYQLNIDGQLDEPVWANLSDMRESDKTSHQHFADGEGDKTAGPADLYAGYSDMDETYGNVNTAHYHGTSLCTGTAADRMRFKYEYRTDGTDLYCAVVVFDKYGGFSHTNQTNGDTTYLRAYLKEKGATGWKFSVQLQVDGYGPTVTKVIKREDGGTFTADEQGQIKGAGMRINNLLVSYEFKIPLALIGTADNYTMTLETYENASPSVGYSNSNGTGTGGWRVYDVFAQASNKNVKKNSHGTVGKTISGYNINGQLTDDEWSSMNAVDYYVNRSYKQGANSSTWEGDIYSYMDEIVADHDYIYGASVILLKDGVQKADPAKADGEYTMEATAATTYRLWLKNSTDANKFTRVVSIYLGKDGDTRVMINSKTESSAFKQDHIIYAKDEKGVYNAYEYKTKNDKDLTATGDKEYGLKAEMKVLSEEDIGNFDDYEEKYPDMAAAIKADRVVVIEYQIPHRLVETDMPANVDSETEAFRYLTSVEDGWNTNGGIGYMNAAVTDSGEATFLKVSPNPWPSGNGDVVITAGDEFDFVKIDGMRTESFWNDYSDYIGVNGSTGYYDPPNTTNNNIAFGQTAYVSDSAFYGFAILDFLPNEDTTYSLWINANPEVLDSKFTHKFTFKKSGEDITVIARDADNNVIATSDKYKTIKYKANVINGRTWIEYMVDLDLFDEDRSGFEYMVSATHSFNGEPLALYYPSSETTDTIFVAQLNPLMEDKSSNTGAINRPRKSTIITKEYLENAKVNILNGWGEYFIFNPTDSGVANEFKVEGVYTCPAGNDPWKWGHGEPSHIELKSRVADGGFIYVIYNTKYYSEYDNVNQKDIINSWKSIYGYDYIDDCYERFAVGNIVRFSGEDFKLDEQRIPTDTTAIMQSVYGFELDALDIKCSVVGNTDEEVRNVNFPDHGAWYEETALKVKSLGRYIPETITIDGIINDNGWDDNAWTYVTPHVNGSIQEEHRLSDTAKADQFSYYYQMRTDGENVYFAFALEDVDFFDGKTTTDRGDATKENKNIQSIRVWIKSNGEKNGVDYSDAISFTHLYNISNGVDGADVSQYNNSKYDVGIGETVLQLDADDLDIHGQQHVSENWYLTEENKTTSYAGSATEYDRTTQKLTYNSTILRFDEHTADATGGFLFPWGGNAARTTGKATTKAYGYGDSLLFGATEEIMEDVIDGTAGDNWWAYTDTTAFVVGKEHGRIDTADGGSASFSIGESGKKYSLVEFKFNLAEIGCANGEGFEYFVHAAETFDDPGAPYTLFSPAITNIPGNRTTYTAYSLPFWNWDSATSLKYNAQTEYNSMLRNSYKPVVTLGVKLNEPDKPTAIKFGGYYTEEFIRRLEVANGNIDRKNSDGDRWDSGSAEEGRILGGANCDGITDYWDVEKVGIVFYFTQKLTLDANRQPELYIDTPNAVNVDSVGIQSWKTDSNFADYETFEFYVVLENMSEALKNVKYSFRSYIKYYDWEGSPIYYDTILERSWNQVNDELNNSDDPGDDDEDDDDTNQTPNHNGKVIAYIPLDNRPVNIDRAQYLAESAGFNLLMPPEELYSTEVDNADTTDVYESAVGDPVALFSWLQENEDNADYFVISLDQLLSGGLVGSRDYAGIDDLTAETGADYDPNLVFEGQVIDYLAGLVTRKDVVLFDSQMRLASTPSFNHTDMNLYTGLRLGFAEKARLDVEITTGTDDELLEIFDNYELDSSGNYILGKDLDQFSENDPITFTIEGKNYTVTAEQIKRNLDSRKRKMLISDMLFDKGVISGAKYFYIGIDDSLPKDTIQTDETEWLEKRAETEGISKTKFKVFSGIDEIGLMSMSACVTMAYGKVNVVIDYFGDQKDAIADEYASGDTLKECIETHVNMAGGQIYNGVPSKNTLHILVLTSDTQGLHDGVVVGSGVNSEDVQALIKKAMSNLANGIPTCIVDGSRDHDGLGNQLVDSDVKISQLLGYSNWNTVSNAAGLAISPAISRFTYLKNSAVITDESNLAALKQITYSFVKDVGYKLNNGTAGTTTADRETNAKKEGKFYDTKDKILSKINGEGSEVLIGVGDNYATESIGTIQTGYLYWPWNRGFEANFKLSIAANVDTSKNYSQYKTYTTDGTLHTDWQTNEVTNYNDDGEKLTNSVWEIGSDISNTSSGWGKGLVTVTINLEQIKEIGMVKVISTHNFWGIAAMKSIKVYVSKDGVDYEELKAGSLTIEESSTSLKDGNNTIKQGYFSLVCPEETEAQYVKVECISDSNVWLTEIEVYGVQGVQAE